MKKLILNVHSFTDAISNSSSETLICAGNKTVSTIKEIIESLVDIYNQESELYNSTNKDQEHFWPRIIISKSNIWTDIFREPEINEFDINIPQSLILFDKMHSSGWNSSNWKGHDFNAEDKIKQIYKFRYDLENDPARTKYPDKDKLSAKEYKKQEKQYNKEWREILDKVEKYQNEVLADYYKAYEDELVKFYKQLAKDNDLDFEDFGEYDFSHYTGSVHIHFKDIKYDDNYKISRLINETSTCLSYNYNLKNGDIIISSANDNAIPYELMESVEKVLSAKRYHIG